MTTSPVGAILMAWARRFCPAQDFEMVALPIIADIQFETAAQAHRSPLVRGWTRLRGILAFSKALTLTVLLNNGRGGMHSKAFAWLRLLVAIPAAVLVSFAVQVGVGRGLSYLVYSVGGLTLGRGGEFGGWLAKLIMTPFMAAAFFWTLYLIAPGNRRRPVAVAALVIIGLWGALMVTGSVTPWPRFHGWLFAIGIAGWLAGTLSYWLTRRGRAIAAAGA